MAGVCLVLLIVGFGVWMGVRARRGIPVAQVVGPEAVLAVHLRDTRKDPGTRQMMGQVQRMQSRIMREQLQRSGPPGAEAWRDIVTRLEGMSRFSAGSIPEAVLALEPDLTGTNVFNLVGAVRVGGMAKLIASFTMKVARRSSKGSLPVRSYRGTDFLDLGGNGYLAFSGGLLLYAEAAASMERLLDRMLDQTAGEALTGRVPAEESASWDLLLVGRNEEGHLERLPQYLQDRWEAEGSMEFPFRFEGVEWGWVGIDLHTGDWIRGRVRLVCREEGDAAAWAARVQDWIEPQLEPLQKALLGLCGDSSLIGLVLAAGRGGLKARRGFRLKAVL